MYIRLYQIDPDIDFDGVCFCRYSQLKDLQGTSKVDSSIYIKVFEGEVSCKTLQGVFQKFHGATIPESHKGRPMNISDVVEVIGIGTFSKKSSSKFYYCNTDGFYKIEFDKSRVFNYSGLPDGVNFASVASF